MKIYISGKITGLPLPEARQRFEDAAVFLVTIKGQQYFINKLVYKTQHP